MFSWACLRMEQVAVGLRGACCCAERRRSSVNYSIGEFSSNRLQVPLENEIMAYVAGFIAGRICFYAVSGISSASRPTSTNRQTDFCPAELPRT